MDRLHLVLRHRLTQPSAMTRELRLLLVRAPHPLQLHRHPHPLPHNSTPQLSTRSWTPTTTPILHTRRPQILHQRSPMARTKTLSLSEQNHWKSRLFALTTSYHGLLTNQQRIKVVFLRNDYFCFCTALLVNSYHSRSLYTMIRYESFLAYWYLVLLNSALLWLITFRYLFRLCLITN